MTTCDMCPTCNHKKAGRKPKYTNDEDRKRAKQEQTNKCIQRIYEKKRALSLQKKEEQLINLFLGKLNKLNINKMAVIQKVVNYLHV